MKSLILLKKVIVLLTAIFVFSGCKKQEMPLHTSQPELIFRIDNEFLFNRTKYKQLSDFDNDLETEKLIGFIIQEKDINSFEFDNKYLYGFVKSFSVKDYDKIYLPVYSIKKYDSNTLIAIRIENLPYIFVFINLEETLNNEN